MPDGRRSAELLGLLIVFVASGAILVLEVMAGRMLAPYVGVTLQSYTGAIGAVLAGIALGSWIGGKLADRLDTARLPASLLILSGAMAACTVPAVRGFGPLTDRLDSAPRILVLCATIFLPPAATLSAIAPAIVKLRLSDSPSPARWSVATQIPIGERAPPRTKMVWVDMGWLRADTTVVPADIKYPTDSGLLVKGITKTAGLIARIQADGVGRIAALRRQHGWDRARIRGLAGARVRCGWGVLCHNAIKIAALTI